MALEPATISLDDGPNEELVEITRRFWVGLVLTLPVFVMEMGGHVTGLTEWIGQQNSGIMQQPHPKALR
jgi:Cu+-exporting ATPase